MERNRIPDNMVVITQGTGKGCIGFVQHDVGGDTVNLRLSGGLLQKRRSDFRPLALDDMVVV